MNEEKLSMILFSFFAKFPDEASMYDRASIKENFVEAIRENRKLLSAEEEIQITRAFLDANSDTR